MSSVQPLIYSGSLLLAVPVAVAAGAVSFASPCVLPLVPGYLSYVTGMSAVDAQDRQSAERTAADGEAAAGRWSRFGARHRTLLGALLFVLGFSAVFVSAGAAFGYAGAHLLAHQRGLDIAFGLVMILMGVFFAGLVPDRWSSLLMRDARVHYRPAMGLVGAPLLGVVFGLGWTPCLGPTLAVVQELAVDQGTAVRGAVLAAFYCLGLGLPFLLTALLFGRAMQAIGWLKRHYTAITRLGGGMLALVGLALVSGVWQQLIAHMQSLVHGFNLPL
ncbi:cytochrome c biogenesis CcdA family protein [Actinospica robiniae]|uniref:cytochrome c biogenesis CcdA family protein n=1 Tax=Actinospica robiniae TaxID=304901 RepID=UPI00041FB222|nr:cytochrome c biogenesis protein CcdA [Actinospica robiniae]